MELLLCLFLLCGKGLTLGTFVICRDGGEERSAVVRQDVSCWGGLAVVVVVGGAKQEMTTCSSKKKKSISKTKE